MSFKGGGGPGSALKRPDILAAIREIAQKSTNRSFRPDCLAMLLRRFQMTVTKGQLAGVVWREGIVIAASDGEMRKIERAEAIAAADRRNRDAEIHRARDRDNQAILRAIRAAAPPMLDHRSLPKPRRAVPPAQDQNLPVAPSLPFSMLQQPIPSPVPERAPPARAPQPLAAPFLGVRPPEAPRPAGRVARCVFPIGDPGADSFRYCEDPTHPGRPYCRFHCQASYVGFRADRDESIISAA